jgi:hypothetical protein
LPSAEKAGIYHEINRRQPMILQLLKTGAILAAGLLLVIYLEHIFISGPRRREMERKARERIEKAKNNKS